MKLLPGSVSLVTKGNYLFLIGIETDAEHLRPIAVRFDARKKCLARPKTATKQGNFADGTCIIKQQCLHTGRTAYHTK